MNPVLSDGKTVFKSLWARAPWWRTCLMAATFLSVVVVFFPPAIGATNLNAPHALAEQVDYRPQRNPAAPLPLLAGGMTAKGVTYPQDFMVVRFFRAEKWGLLEANYWFSPELEGIKSNSVPSFHESDWEARSISRFPEKQGYVGKLKNWGAAFWPRFQQAFVAGRPSNNSVGSCCGDGTPKTAGPSACGHFTTSAAVKRTDLSSPRCSPRGKICDVERLVTFKSMVKPPV